MLSLDDTYRLLVERKGSTVETSLGGVDTSHGALKKVTSEPTETTTRPFTSSSVWRRTRRTEEDLSDLRSRGAQG
jgi:hypothetical protein